MTDDDTTTNNRETALLNEAACLKKEFEWVLTEEVHTVLVRLQGVLMQCVRKFPLPVYGNEVTNKSEKRYILTDLPDKIRTVISMVGDTIVQADIQFKTRRQRHSTIYHTGIQKDHPWKLHQLQEVANHLQQSLFHVDDMLKEYCSFCSSDEVLHTLDKILGCLQRGRVCLINPKIKTVEELMKSKESKVLFPALPEDLFLNFYLHNHKIILAVYQQLNLKPRNPVRKLDVYHSECPIPWINEVLILLTVALQVGQQLKDKISVFAQYKDLTITPRRPSKVTIKT